MSNNQFESLARFILNESIDYGEMEEGRVRIGKLFSRSHDFLIEGKTYGETVLSMKRSLEPYGECHLDLIPEEEPFHSCPEERRIRRGELITLDCSLKVKQLWADRAMTIAVGEVDRERRLLLNTAKEAFNVVKEASKPNMPFSKVNDILFRMLDDSPCSLVPDCGGHGIGHQLHQDQEFIYSDRHGVGIIPSEGAFTVEPVIALDRKDGTTIYGYFEDTIIIG